MIKKIIITILLSIFAPVLLSSENQLSTTDPVLFEARLKNIQESINYLKTKDAEIKDLNKLYSETEYLLIGLKNLSDTKESELSAKYLSHKFSVLEEKISERASFIKKMNIIYFIAVITGLCIIVFALVYSIYLYKRSR